MYTVKKKQDTVSNTMELEDQTQLYSLTSTQRKIKLNFKRGRIQLNKPWLQSVLGCRDSTEEIFFNEQLRASSLGLSDS